MRHTIMATHVFQCSELKSSLKNGKRMMTYGTTKDEFHVYFPLLLFLLKGVKNLSRTSCHLPGTGSHLQKVDFCRPNPSREDHF